MPTSQVRTAILGMELSPTARSTRGLKTTSREDRQVIADATQAKATYLITTDVDDFAVEDLAAHEMSAVNPDYFMALRFSVQIYREAVALIASVQKNPPRTEEEVHHMLGRRHPYLSARFADVYDTAPVPADPDQPTARFRGVVCIRCDARLGDAEGSRIGLCGEYQPGH